MNHSEVATSHKQKRANVTSDNADAHWRLAKSGDFYTAPGDRVKSPMNRDLPPGRVARIGSKQR